MTYLQMVNNVLKRLRERTVSSVNENPYSALIGVLINDAKREVEDAWDWSALRNTISITTTADIFNYVLTGSQNRITVLDVLNDTTNRFLTYKEAHWMNEQFLLGTPPESSPMFYSYNGVDTNGDTQVEFYPIPDGPETIRFNCVKRTADLSTDSSKSVVPDQPILMLAYAKAIEERGEDGGVNASSAYIAAQRALSDAISLDASKHPEELIWREV